MFRFTTKADERRRPSRRAGPSAIDRAGMAAARPCRSRARTTIAARNRRKHEDRQHRRCSSATRRPRPRTGPERPSDTDRDPTGGREGGARRSAGAGSRAARMPGVLRQELRRGRSAGTGRGRRRADRAASRSAWGHAGHEGEANDEPRTTKPPHPRDRRTRTVRPATHRGRERSVPGRLGLPLRTHPPASTAGTSPARVTTNIESR